jgi:tryptophanyl-tRNA synthetase
VGRDQLQHLEIARDVTAAFNRAFGPTLTRPEAVIDPELETIPGTDGRKMSKSYDNVLSLFAPPEATARAIRQVVTDSARPEDPKDPDRCSLFALYRHLADEEASAALAKRYRAGGVAYAEVKAELARLFDERFCSARRRYEELMADHQALRNVLADGANRARHRAREVLANGRAARGVAS